MEKLKRTRKTIGITQNEAAHLLGVSRRTYQTYESVHTGHISPEQEKELERLVEMIEAYSIFDKTHGVLGRKTIVEGVRDVLKNYPKVTCAYLFGSYARKEAGPKSDIDLIVVLDEDMGLEFFGMVADLEERLNKNVDVVTHHQLAASPNLLSMVLKEGVKIYG